MLRLEPISELDGDRDIVLVIRLIDGGDYKQACENICRIIADYEQQSSLYQLRRKYEGDITGLKTTARLLEIQVSVLRYKKTDYTRIINNFRIRHNNEIGEIVTEILRIRKELLSDKLEENPDIKNEYEQAKNDYEEYSEAYRASKNIRTIELDAADKKRLQKLFRKAGKSCHPDSMA